MKPESRAPGTGTRDLPIPKEGICVTHMLIVRDLARSRQFYESVLDATVLMEGPSAILRFHNSWIILAPEGEPTDDRPGIAAGPPRDLEVMTCALNLRVADIRDLYELWRSRGAQFLTPPKEHSSEIRCYLRDPDGHLIEVGQAKESGNKR